MKRPFSDASERATAIGVLAAGVAHDVNNMLSVVLTYAEVLGQRLEPGTPEASELHELRVAAQRAADLVRQLLSVGRRAPARPERLDLGAVVGGIERMLRILVGQRVDVRIGATGDLWPIHADRARVEEIAINLVTNARDAMDGVGRLSIETGNIELPAGPHVVLSVSDSGRGMDDATLARIFEPFFTTRECGKGSGLGLAVVAALVEELGGTIGVTSAVGKGTTFRVCLPRDDGKVA